MQIKVKVTNEAVQTALQAIEDNSAAVGEYVAIDFEVAIGTKASIYTIVGLDATVSFETTPITVIDEDGNSITLEALKNYTYSVDINGTVYVFVAKELSRQLSALKVAAKIIGILVDAKKKELGLGKVKTARKPSESREKNEKLQAEKALLAKLRAERKERLAKEKVDASEEDEASEEEIL